MSIQNKTAIVTGGSRGIGAAIATRLGKEGFNVIVNYAGSEVAAEKVVAEIEASGGKAVVAQADVADSAAVKRMFDLAESAFGGVDVLINNAGIMKLGPLAQADDAQIESQIDINLKGPINTMRVAAKRLRNDGRIVNLSSSVAALKFETYGIYAATKGAIEVLTGILAKEMRGRGVTVNAVAPGPTGTELFLDGKSDAVIEKLSKANPLERLGTPEDIANVVAFLVGPDGAWVNGQVLRANGGMI
ncbi:SDR family oxidoreductase [Celeribacter halophilus]|uniref:SDR family oxidoreductase n=1 Tax=Celeribacter halophilus TaxID=576117 RepID=UPI001C0982FB|nr:SDR family oxidoreductase [Celeribacter halophilus]MBU2889912.1 SDR family oxidoreductase [Celeribacter halophilus]MDO6512193.1 SDR family oxidoreductase [Celeribacter halophilus]